MPGILARNEPALAQAGHVAEQGWIWTKHQDSITADQLQTFWSELPFQARQKLLRVDKQTLFEQARKNLYCSRCNGLLLESFSQIVLHEKSSQQEGDDLNISNQTKGSQSTNETEEELEDPAEHSWGGLTLSRDGTLTILDGYICTRSLKEIQSVFDSAQERERERELLYPDACGGGGRGWISQAMTGYGRGHGNRETCALHTARLSCDTLVDFWSALGEETRSSLFRMKEEDFIERLMYRFDSKRFCRDCRRNVIREFKELKELKRMRREPRCTSWFCAADSAFEYEVSEDTVQVDWRQFFTDSAGMYHHFEWAMGTAEGKSDILDFEDIGMNDMVEVNGLDLGGLSACFITLRAWKLDGRCSEFCVKAHALKGQQCVHRRLIVGDGYVTISKGESIRRFFEHAEEAEEEEDDDSVDKDGNDIDGGVSRPQKHAKSPELAREFLLDAATVIFKEQVEKAFREGTTRQNAHSVFICLALKLLEERLHVACKEIITLAKQTKLLEEEEREKREEEERKERRKAKEREKKLRRKERLKGKERENKSNLPVFVLHTSSNDSSTSTLDDLSNTPDSGDSVSESGDSSLITSFESLDISGVSCEGASPSSDALQKESLADRVVGFTNGSKSFSTEHSKIVRRSRNRTDHQYLYDMGQPCTNDENGNAQSDSDFTRYNTAATCTNSLDRAPRERPTRNNMRNCNTKFNDKLKLSSARLWDQHEPCEPQACGCSSQIDRRVKDVSQMPRLKSVRDTRSACKTEYALDQRSSLYHNVRFNSSPANGVKSKGKFAGPMKQVWEPLDARRKNCRSSSDDHKTTSYDVSIDQLEDIGVEKREIGWDQPGNSDPVVGPGSLGGPVTSDDVDLGKLDKSVFASSGFQDDVELLSNSDCYSNIGAKDDINCHVVDNSESITSSSSSDNCSSCPSEGDSSTSSSSAQNAESSTSESEEQYESSKFQNPSPDINKNGGGLPTNVGELLSENTVKTNLTRGDATKSFGCDNSLGSHMVPQPMYIPKMQSCGMNVSVLPSQVARYTSCSSTWSAASNGVFIPLLQNNQYAFSRPLGYVLPVHQPPKYGAHYSPVQTTCTVRPDAIRNSSFQEANCMNIVHSNGRGNKFGHSQLNTFVEPIQWQQKALPLKPACTGDNGQLETNVKSNQNAAFSLFHFGDHVAGYPIGLTLNPQFLNQENSGAGCDDRSFGMAHGCSDQGIKMEEYSLFSTRNADRFSFLY